MHFTQKGSDMEAVTGQSEVIQLAEKVVGLCRAHTDSATIAMTAVQIAEKVIFSEQLCKERSESAEVPGQSSVIP